MQYFEYKIISIIVQAEKWLRKQMANIFKHDRPEIYSKPILVYFKKNRVMAKMWFFRRSNVNLKQTIWGRQNWKVWNNCELNSSLKKLFLLSAFSWTKLCIRTQERLIYTFSSERSGKHGRFSTWLPLSWSIFTRIWFDSNARAWLKITSHHFKALTEFTSDCGAL